MMLTLDGPSLEDFRQSGECEASVKFWLNSGSRSRRPNSNPHKRSRVSTGSTNVRIVAEAESESGSDEEDSDLIEELLRDSDESGSETDIVN